ncbi:DEAD/DEAH box helicase [Mesobacillus subterraneus]|uniref:DEAD/DEAH box helicase n=1 Tax=Mesobacillus subterraneus TaxID=285983 RepID=UPI00203C2976|nr:DEAD/DEAH box helicase [Mesobacillus subterraneus]MCM3666204.1 DEAD/DEAH box helicase [Mesobacillus subterraneus]MCM3685202.1 DEAD/DEAH box helicase [Mesobacillus subterraneus]
MDLKLNHKVIKELCGTVSFKRGDAFYRADKVKFTKYSKELAVATVTGADEFHVTVRKNNDGFTAQCSCPKLASIKTECQHVAAVLIAILDKQRQGIEQLQVKGETENGLAEGLLTLFSEQPRRSSRHQLHFETRKVLNTEFRVRPVNLSKKQTMLGIAMKIGPIAIQDIRGFLASVKDKEKVSLSGLFAYDPELHCFQGETDVIIKALIQVVEDEEALQNTFAGNNETLLISPSTWDQLLPLLTKVPNAKVEYAGGLSADLRISSEKLPLLFDFEETDDKNYRLKIDGLTQLVLLNAYDLVLYQGQLIQLNSEDSNRLYELIQMLESSGTNEIPIRKDQMSFFVEKVVPGLRRIGEVRINGDITRQFLNTPLIAKLYLDRVNNRLLAGLEFQYDNIVFNPLEGREPQTNSMLIRNTDKEDLILGMLDESSFAKTDGGYFLHNEDLEYEFLYHVMPKLQKLVQVYATTAVRNRIFREPARPQIRVKVKKERTNWLEFKFGMDGIPEKYIRDILEALEEKRKYYRLRNGALMSLETREWEEIQRFLKAGPIQDEDLEKGLNVPIVRGMQMLESFEDGSVLRMEDSFRGFLDEISTPGKVKFDIPDKLEPILREYQKQGFHWMKTLARYGFGGILADDMGLGKTVQSITYIASELSDVRKRQQPILIVCPSSLIYNWLSEFMKFTPDIQAVIIDGNKTERSKLLNDFSGIDVVITSYMLLRRDIHLYEKMNFHTVFFDEAQAFKNPLTQTAKAVMNIQADHRFALTGTPIENSIEDLWSIFRVVFPELFQGLKEYSNLTSKTIARRIRPFLLRRVKEEVLGELPEKIESIDRVELLPEQKKLYAAYLAKLRHQTLKQLDKNTIRKNRIKILAGLTRLRQICCHPALFVDGYMGSSAKFEQLKQIIEESRFAGRRVLIFSQFTKMLDLIGKELAYEGIPFFYLDGQTPSQDRVETCERFNNGERDFFLISLKAGGTGLNLTGADTVILYDLWWNPAVEQQAADRAHRMGQKNQVQVIKLIARGTIEEKMNELQDKKRNMIEEIIEEKSSATLTEEDIREILQI